MALPFLVVKNMSFVYFMQQRYYADIYKKAGDGAKEYLKNEWENNAYVGDKVRDDFQSVKDDILGRLTLDDIEFLYKWSIGEEKLMFKRMRDAKGVLR